MIGEQKQLKYFEGVGRRKTAIARARIYPEKKNGKIIINGFPCEKYFKIERQKKAALRPLIHINLDSNMVAEVKVIGSGLSSQADAVSLALARALVKQDESRRPIFRGAGLLTRDSRMVERKKYGLKKARRAPQWAKR